MSDITNFNVSDFSGLFSKEKPQNRLLQALNIFDFSTVDQSKTTFDYLLNSTQSALTPKSRYGSEFDSTVKTKSSLHLIELPYFSMLNIVSTEDWQGKRMPGTERAMDQDDVSAKLLYDHNLYLEDTIEAYMAQALFKGQQVATGTQEPLIDFQTEFGLSIGSETIAWGSSAVSPVEGLDSIHSKIRKALGDKQRYLKRIVCVCGPTYFQAVKQNSFVMNAFHYVQPYDPNNMILNFQEIVPAHQTFDYNNVSFIVTDNDLHGVGTNEAYYFPQLSNGSGVFDHVGGPASKHQQLAAAGGRRYFQYTCIDPKWRDVNVVAEMSLLCINKLPNVVIKSTYSA